MEPIRAELQDVFREVFGDDEIVLSDSTTADDVDGWDSMMHINLIIGMEKRFGVKFAAAEIAGHEGRRPECRHLDPAHRAQADGTESRPHERLQPRVPPLSASRPCSSLFPASGADNSCWRRARVGFLFPTCPDSGAGGLLAAVPSQRLCGAQASPHKPCAVSFTTYIVVIVATFVFLKHYVFLRFIVPAWVLITRSRSSA